MATKCKECIFKDIDGGKYPCNDCSEIMDLTGAKSIKSHFKTIVKYNKNTRPKKRLEHKLNEISILIGKKIIHAEYENLEDGNMMLTAFFQSGKSINVYQIIDTGEELLQNVVSVDKELFRRVGGM